MWLNFVKVCREDTGFGSGFVSVQEPVMSAYFAASKTELGVVLAGIRSAVC